MSTVQPKVAVLMGSQSDASTMAHCLGLLKELEIPYVAKVRSVHRAPDAVRAYVVDESEGICVFIAAAGGAAHLPGMVSSHTTKPVIGVPIKSSALSGLDSLLSIVQMPGGVPVSTMAIGDAGAKNAALSAAAILALTDKELEARLKKYRSKLRDDVLADDDPEHPKQKK